MTRELYQRMAELEREGRRFAVATVVRTSGSTPQVVGAKLVVDDLGRLTGTLGGGCVEADAVDEAKRILGEGGASLREYELTEDLAWDTGLVCGGTMWIDVEPGDRALEVAGRDFLGDVLAASGGGRPVALATLLEKKGKEVIPSGRLFVEDGGRVTGSVGDAALQERAVATAREVLRGGAARVVPLDEGGTQELLVEPVLSRPRLVIAGGGHVSLALARMAFLLDYEVTVIEDRAEYARRDRFVGAEVMHGNIAETLGSLDLAWNTFVVIATRGHKLDAHALRAAVRSSARYVGLLGSRRKTVLIAKMLAGEGVPQERIRAVHAPVGLDLGGRTPAEIALSILAELAVERYGGSARPLRIASDVLDRSLR
ncbi:MAG: XdhC family protein [Deltaproteobacteria bacterium]|nr:XdhC family protein [Deltaproteobacteria bacterium]